MENVFLPQNSTGSMRTLLLNLPEWDIEMQLYFIGSVPLVELDATVVASCQKGY